MGAKFDAPEMSLENLQEVMRREHPSIRNVNFRRIKIPTLLRGWFQNCTFTGCDFTDAEINSCFTDCSFYDLTAKRMCLTKSWFQGGTIADTRFEDCKVSDTVFAFVEAKNISIATTELEKCAFQGGNMDRVFFHHGVKASGIDGLESVAITMGGATEPEAHNHIRQIYRALLGPDCLQTLRLEYEELKRRYSKDIFSLIKSAEAAIPHNCHSCVFNGMQECAGQQAKDGLGFAQKCPCWEWEKGWRIQVQSFFGRVRKGGKGVSYDIIYDLQFIRTSRGVTPVILAGPNNVTTGSGKHEHRVRSWGLWSSEMVDIPETDLIEIIQDSVANYDANYTLFKRGGKWVNPDGLIQMFRSACKKAARIEDIYAADRSGYLSCSVKYYEGHSMKAIDRINEIIKTTESFEAWIDAARREYETMKKQGKDVWLNVQFNSGEKPLKKASGAKGPVILREGKDRYVKDYTENSVEFTGNPEDAKVFNDAASAQNEIHPVLFSKMRIVSANVINRKRNMNIALRDNDDFYIAGLTARRLKYTRHFGDAKKFASVEAARAWFKKYQIAERFPVFADALPVDGEGIRKSSLCQDPVK